MAFSSESMLDQAGLPTLVLRVRSSIFLAVSDRCRRSLCDGGILRLSVGDELAKHGLLEAFQVGPEGARAGVKDAHAEVGRQTLGKDVPLVSIGAAERLDQELEAMGLGLLGQLDRLGLGLAEQPCRLGFD